MWFRKGKIVKAGESNINLNHFYKSVFVLVIPLALQNLINVGVTAADVIMLGRVGESVLAGAAIANQIQFIMILLLFGLGSGITVLAAQYWGKGDKGTIEKILAMGMRISFVITLFFNVLAVLIPTYLLQIFTREAEVIANGRIYLQIVAFSYVFMGITMTYLLVMRSIQRVIVATVVYSCSLVVNVILNFILIFGISFGFGALHIDTPALGIQGAAIGTVFARILEVLLIFIYARFFNKDVKFRWKNLFQTDKVLLKDFIRYAMPVVGNEAIWGVAISANTAILGHLGSEAIAANSVAQVVRQLATVVSFGLASTTAIYLGKTIGEKKFEEAKVYAKKFTQLSLIMGVVGGILILIASSFVVEFMVLSQRAAGYLQFMLIVMAYYVVAQAYNATFIVGISRAGGDTKFGLYADTFSMWTGSLLLAFLAGYVFRFSVPVVYVLLMADELIKVPLSALRYKSFKWLKNVTREFGT
ncbi:MAG: MATE family efflux transporter [Lachnospiraceae bacterium]|nr:MATE family efflux transporter [Lachnospiraceae bacterium]